jgi:heat-inducible transcriptional repressor
MLDDRKAAILRAVVEEYIQTAQPVGSAHIARAAAVGVSSATVRNEMAALEREGYLVHPHTSAGRVPTDKGYRFFVDHLSPAGTSLPVAHKQRVQEFFAEAHGELEQMLRDTGRLLSDLTHYAALVVAPRRERTTVRSVQLVGLGGRTALAVAVLANGAVQKAVVDMDTDTSDDRVARAGAHLAAHLVGRGLADEAPLPPSGDDGIDRLAAAASESLRQPPEQESVFVGGTAQMAAMFDAVEKVRQVLAILEQQFVVVGLLREALHEDRLSVSIGTEHGVAPLADCSLVVAPYDTDGSDAGTIGVLGPTRMNYAQAMAAVAVVSQQLGRHLRDGT